MQLSARKSFAVGVAALTFGLGACDPNVDYLRAGSGGSGGAGGANVNVSGDGGATSGGATSGGATSGGDSNQGGSDSGAGSGGATSAGASGSAGSDAMGGSATTGGATGGNASGGSAGVPSLCIPNQVKLIELFAFDQTTPPIANVVNGSPGTWQKGPYDTTDTATGLIDATATPPTNAKNLANLSTLALESTDGNPLPAMKVSIPFSGKNVTNPGTQKPEPEHMHLIYIFAQIGQTTNTVDFTARRFTADVKAVANPRTACQLTINAWTTGTNAAATTFMHVDGPITTINDSTWTQVTMDLATSTPKTAVNQYGFAINSTCPTTTAVPDGLMTVLLFDNIRTACD
jgi:hypothetical protein